jgi:hypothetical protein
MDVYSGEKPEKIVEAANADAISILKTTLIKKIKFLNIFVFIYIFSS